MRILLGHISIDDISGRAGLFISITSTERLFKDHSIYLASLTKGTSYKGYKITVERGIRNKLYIRKKMIVFTF